MKNLFKTLITVITVVCMLSSMTAFAASQTTVTKYVSGTEVNVETIVSELGADAIVTYLVANDANKNGTADADEIKYINQGTAIDGSVTFSYAITGEGWTPANTIADVKFGSNDADAAATLNDDVVIYDDIEFIVKDADGNNVPYGAELSKEYFIGKGESADNVVISALPGYVIESITIGGASVNKDLAAHTVAYGQKVEVVVSAIKDTTVYLFTDATAEDGYKVYDAKTDAELSVLTGIGYYVGGPVESASIVFAGIDIDGAHKDYTYEATVGSEPSGYFAVQLAQAEDFAEGAVATNAIVVKDGSPVPAK